MKILYSILPIITGLFLSCQPSGGQNVETLNANDFQQKLSSQPNPQLVDVRTREEFQSGHLIGALNVDYNSNDFGTKMAYLDKTKPVYVYCYSGGRSSSAAKWLTNNGFSQVYDLKGGINLWQAQNKPSESTGVDQETGWSTVQFDSLSKIRPYVLINFSATWCPPCKKMAPSLDSLSQEWNGKISVIKVDAVANPLTVQYQKVNAFPTLILFKDGKPVWRHEGYLSNTQIKKQTNPYL